MDNTRIKIYTAVKMTGRFCDAMRQESEMLVRVLTAYGFEVLNPVIEEAVPYDHVLLEQVNAGRLAHFWARDKEMIRDADILLDYMSCSTSDGVNTEVGYARWCLWKPVVRVWPGVETNISKIEHDAICENLTEAIMAMQEKWGTYEKLKIWREEMLAKSFLPWISEQHKLNHRYGINRGLNII